MVDKIQVYGVDSTVVAMTKQEFFALAEKRIRDNAGSGFAEWGKHSNVAGFPNVNEGIWQQATDGNPNTLCMGRSGVNGTGVSRAEYPIVMVNGVHHRVTHINKPSDYNRIKFPPAPDGTKTYDSATGVVTQHASAAEAFEGVLSNGDFRNGDDGSWIKGGNAVVNVGYALLDRKLGNISTINQNTNVPDGEKYRVRLTITNVFGSNNSHIVVRLGNAGGSTPETRIDLYIDLNETVNVDVLLEQNPAGSQLPYIEAITYDTQFEIRSVSVMPEDEDVITSRQDYVFLESWYEKIADKGEVYPLGNVQYGAADYNGITLSTRDDGYTRFGEWDSETTGKYAVWDDLSFEEKAIFLSDPENNIYQDGDDLIQVRYRIRVVEGLGDKWERVTTEKEDLGSLWYQDSSDGDAYKIVAAKGQQVSITSEFVSTNNDGVFRMTKASQRHGYGEVTKGHFSAYKNTAPYLESGHNGLCFAVPIALVQRRNKGAYDPELNPLGCRKWNRDDDVTSTSWYDGDSTRPLASSIQDCFFNSTFSNPVVAGYRSDTGYIGKGTRPDGKFYDAIYASDVKDLRMSSRRRPVSEIREEAKRKAIAGEIRGFEPVPVAKTFITNRTSESSGVTGAKFKIAEVDGFTGLTPTDTPATGYGIRTDTGEAHKITLIEITATHVYVTMPTAGKAETYVWNIVVSYYDNDHKQANPTWTDIIGDPANIAATFPNGVEGQWIPIVPTGSNVRYNQAKLNRKKVDGTTQPRLYTDDNGGSWLTASIATSETTNAPLATSFLPVARVELWQYETQAHFVSDDVNSEVFDLGGVQVSNAAEASLGNILTSNLTGNVATSSGYRVQQAPLTMSYVSPIIGKLFQSSGAYRIEHTNISLDSSSNAVKTLDYLSSNNGAAKLCYAYKEMIYDDGANNAGDFTVVDGTVTSAYAQGETYRIITGAGNVVKTFMQSSRSLRYTDYTELSNGDVTDSSGTIFFVGWDGNGWGDDNQFQIVDNQDSFTDDNGNVGVRGTASFDTQYFIDGSN